MRNKSGLIYFLIWATSIGSFWLGLGRDAMGYSLVVLYALIPLSVFVLSIARGINGCSLKAGVGLALLLGMSNMMVEYLTFSLANMVSNSFSHLNMPELSLLAIGFVLSLLGLIVGRLVSALRGGC